MKKMKNKKILVIGAILGSLAIGAIFIALKIKKLLKYSIKFKGIKFTETNSKKIVFNANFDFKNNSDITLNVSNQEYDIYLNNIFMTTVFSEEEQIILPNAISPLSVTIDLTTKDVLSKIKSLGDGSVSSLLKILTSLKEQDLKIVYKFGIKFGLISIPLTFSYNDYIKNWA